MIIFYLYNALCLFVFLSDFCISFKVKEKLDRKSKTRASGTPLGIAVRITIHSVIFSGHADINHFGKGILTRETVEEKDYSGNWGILSWAKRGLYEGVPTVRIGDFGCGSADLGAAEP